MQSCESSLRQRIRRPAFSGVQKNNCSSLGLLPVLAGGSYSVLLVDAKGSRSPGALGARFRIVSRPGSRKAPYSP